jgi:nitrogen regulatory protein PII
MKRISVILRATEAMAVRKAVCAAGGDRVVITPIAQRACATELADWYCGTSAGKCENHVRLDVTADDCYADTIVGAIVSTAHTGKIEQITRMPARANQVLVDTARKAA